MLSGYVAMICKSMPKNKGFVSIDKCLFLCIINNEQIGRLTLMKVALKKRQGGEMETGKKKVNPNNVRACPRTRFARGTSEFVGMAEPRGSLGILDSRMKKAFPQVAGVGGRKKKPSGKKSRSKEG